MMKSQPQLSAAPIAEPKIKIRPRILPPYHVVVLNDDDHSCDFVTMVLRKVFGYDESKACDLMLHAHTNGEAVVWTGPKEHAEMKYDQIRCFHEHHRADGRDLGPLGCRIEPAQ